MAKSFQKDTNGTLLTNLVSYYKMGGDTTDFYGSNNGTPTAVTFGTGKVNNGAIFANATASKIVVPSSSTFNTASWTVAWWQNISNTSLVTPTSRWNTQGGDGANCWWTQCKTDIFYGYARNTSDTQYGGSYATTLSGWHHIVLRWEAGSTFKYYIDGVERFTTAVTGNAKTGSSDIWIGNGSPNPTNVYAIDGTIDEYGFWSKALSTTEISDLYNSGNGQTMNPPIEYDNSSISSGSNASTKTLSHTCGTGSNRLLLVSVWNNGQTDVVTGVTYGGVSMTPLGTNYLAGTGGFTKLFYLLAPATGANDIITTLSGSTYHRILAASYVGVKQSSFPNASNYTTTASASSITTTLTTTVDGCFTFLATSDGVGGNITAGAGTTQRQVSTDANAVSDSGLPIVTAGSTSLISNSSGSPKFATLMVALAPYAAPTSNIKSFNGLAYASTKSVNGVLMANVKSFNGLS